MVIDEQFQFCAEISRENGTRIDDCPLDIDWEPAVEWTHFESIRDRSLSPDSFLGTAAIEPVWVEELGEPHVAAFRVKIEAPDSDEFTVREFPKGYFQRAVERATRELTREGRLHEGEAFTHKVCAFPLGRVGSSEETVPERSPFAVHRTASTLLMAQRSLDDYRTASVLLNDDQDNSSDISVFLDPQILSQVEELALASGANETGGILIGHLCSDPRSKELFLHVTAQIPAAHTEATSTMLAFTADTWTAVRDALDLRRSGEIWLGWHHSHPVREWCKKCPPESRKVCPLRENFFSEDDVHLHRTVFPRAYSIALVVSLVDDETKFSMFGWREGAVKPRAFHVLEHNDELMSSFSAIVSST